MRNNSLNAFSDRELIDELKGRKYRVIKDEKVHVFSATTELTMAYLLSLNGDEYKQSQIKHLGASIGYGLMFRGCIPIIEEMDPERKHIKLLRATLTFINDQPLYENHMTGEPSNGNS